MSNRILCMIPARIGSERFKKKNLALVQGKPILSWGIKAAINSNIFDEIIINGDHESFREITKSFNLTYYSRDESLASSFARSDDVIFDFIESNKCEYVVWFNAIAPLQTSEDIKGFVNTLLSGQFDSLFSIKSEYVQAIFKNKELNFSKESKFQKTQDLDPIDLFVPSLMGWKTSVFKKKYLKNKFSFFCGNVGFYKTKSRLSSLVIKNEDDFRLIRSVIEGISSYNNAVDYY